MDGFFGWVILPVIGMFVFIFIGGIFGIVRQLDHHYLVQSCHAFATASGYETKWADYNFWDYECLAKTNNGKWVSTDSLRGVNQ